MNMVFNCHLNEGDTFQVAESELVPLHTKEKYAYTLWTRRKGHLNMIPHFFMPEAIDLFYKSAARIGYQKNLSVAINY